MNNQKITSLGNATTDTDVLNRQTADARYYLSSQTLDTFVAPNTNLSLNSQKITNLALAQNNTDMASKQYVSNSINAISRDVIVNATVSTSKLTAESSQLLAGSTPLNMSSCQITSLANPSLSTDAVNKQTADSSLILQTASLDTLNHPAASLDANSQIITGVANATTGADVLNRQSADARYYQ